MSDASEAPRRVVTSSGQPALIQGSPALQNAPGRQGPYAPQMGYVQQQQGGGIPPGQAQQVFTYIAPQVVYSSYKSGQSVRLGAVQIVLGALCIILNVGAMMARSIAAMSGSGIWSGILFIITGSFGVCAAKTRTRCKVVTYMVLCIISAVFTLFVLQSGMGGALSAEYDSSCYYDSCRYDYTTVRMVLHTLLALCALAEVILAIWGSVLGCKVACCCGQPPQVVVGAHYVPMQTQLVVFSPPQQGAGGATNAPLLSFPAPPYPGYQPGCSTSQGSYEGAMGGPLPFADPHVPSASGEASAPPMYCALPPQYSEVKKEALPPQYSEVKKEALP